VKKIIHVDNSSFFRKQMGAFLTKEGFEVESFSNGEDASFVISGGDIAMLICGLSLEDMDGKLFIERVREFFGGPLIVISSSVEKENEETLRGLGVTAALKKTGGWENSLRPYLTPLK
jgi:DNA-binding response OmpR family regulator